uniref:Uncharacterized protein AlNc14C37G3242 n=1 Tax=Albugo laibachii Nc14 TaxID=890382 RepID=F0W8W7_9STRA|nr:conserved hypothetical protein [Albugo laibachii Nc14]|eukprot:CCA17578.1 conserved hypothetical protein [Albugo laibachii Nc14]
MRATTKFLLNGCLEALQFTENDSNKRLLEQCETQCTEDSAFDLCSQSRILADREKVVVIDSVYPQNESFIVVDGQFSIESKVNPELRDYLREKKGYTSLTPLRGSVVRLDRYFFLTTGQCEKLLQHQSNEKSGNSLWLWIEKMTVVETSGLAIDPVANVTQHAVVQSRIDELKKNGELVKTLVSSQKLDEKFLVHQEQQPQEADCIIPEDQEAQLQGQEGWDTQAPMVTDSELIAENDPTGSSASAVGALASQDFYFEQEDISCNFIPCSDVDSDAALQTLSDETGVKLGNMDVSEISEISLSSNTPASTSELCEDPDAEKVDQSGVEKCLRDDVEESTSHKVSSIEITSTEVVIIDEDESEEEFALSKKSLVDTMENKAKPQVSPTCNKGQWHPEEQSLADVISVNNQKLPGNHALVCEKPIHHELTQPNQEKHTSTKEENPKRARSNSLQKSARKEVTSAAKAIPSPRQIPQDEKHRHNECSENDKSNRLKEKEALPKISVKVGEKPRSRPNIKTKKTEDGVPYLLDFKPSLNYGKRPFFFPTKNGHMRPSKRYKHLLPPFNIEAIKRILARPRT